jgi:hypothetical protein
MNPGYVYILINSSMPGLIKIGRTFRDSRERARELYTTGVPSPFQIAFEAYSIESENLEKMMHEKLLDFKVSNGREFFRYPLDKAIALLLQLNAPPSPKEAIYSAEDITEGLRKRFSRYLKPDIVSVRIVQPGNRVWLEIIQEKEIAGYLKDQIITRTDLGFIMGGNHEETFFSPNDSVSINATKFINEFDDPYSIIMTTDLFHEDACKEINEEYNSHRPIN